ncbi:MAG: CDP-alcohol phosphatidyltransferase family protein [Candidatus Eisenbacteria bacterium]|nr:CDP-alcohol phosphatidyltransferase family protein [Candidatus Eisenbacteria bacterium]
MGAGGLKSRIRKVLDPVASLAVRLKIPPDAITVAGLALSAGAGWAFWAGRFGTAGGFLVLAGVCDMVDGATARAGGRASASGAFLDSTLDRYSEVVALAGAFLYYLLRPAGPDASAAVALFLAVSGSILVSYAKARAEAVGATCDVGIAERPERMVLLIVGAFLGPARFRWAAWLLAVLSHATAIHRLGHVLRKLGS